VRVGQLGLQLLAQALLGLPRGLRAAMLELGGLAGVVLDGELALERGTLSLCLAHEAVKAIDRRLSVLGGLLGAALGRDGKAL